MKYFEKRFDGTRLFELDGTRLVVTGKHSLKSEFESNFDLSSISPEFSLLRIRHKLFFVAAGMLLVFSFAGLLTDKLLIMSGAMITAIILMALSFKKQVFYQFSYRSGGIAFDICEAGPERSQTRGFCQLVSKSAAESKPAEG